MRESIYRSDVTGAKIDKEDRCKIEVKCPLNSRSGDYHVGSIDMDKGRIPEELVGTSYSESTETLLVFCEGDVGMGEETPYPRIIGIGIAHNKTLSRKSTIEMYDEQLVRDIEKAIRNRHVVKAKQGMYTE